LVGWLVGWLVKHVTVICVPQHLMMFLTLSLCP